MASLRGRGLIVRESFVRHEVMTDEIGASHGETKRGPSIQRTPKNMQPRVGKVRELDLGQHCFLLILKELTKSPGDLLKKTNSVCQMASETIYPK